MNRIILERLQSYFKTVFKSVQYHYYEYFRFSSAFLAKTSDSEKAQYVFLTIERDGWEAIENASTEQDPKSSTS